MPDRTCPHCQVKGFIRSETVIRAGHAYQSCYCGHCGLTWQAGDCEHTDIVDRADDRASKRSRKP
jgi:hypothetical protein